MSNLRSITVVCALAAAALVTSAFAQERTSPPRPPGGGQIPAGSYQSTCRGASMNGNMLSAQCTGPTGAPVFSSIDTNGCRGRDIANDRGYLRCNAGGGGGPRPPVPPRPVPPPQPPIPTGSYQRSCRGITINGNILRAQCTNTNGAPVSSSIDVNGCRGQDIYNDNGRLRCGGSGPQPPRPPVGGGGNFQAIVYTSANYRGRMMTITGPISNFGDYPGFNDNIRSIRIIRGRAQVCVDSRYRGQCVTIGQSYSDLNRIGMANRISSIR